MEKRIYRRIRPRIRPALSEEDQKVYERTWLRFVDKVSDRNTDRQLHARLPKPAPEIIIYTNPPPLEKVPAAYFAETFQAITTNDRQKFAKSLQNPYFAKCGRDILHTLIDAHYTNEAKSLISAGVSLDDVRLSTRALKQLFDHSEEIKPDCMFWFIIKSVQRRAEACYINRESSVTRFEQAFILGDLKLVTEYMQTGAGVAFSAASGKTVESLLDLVPQDKKERFCSIIDQHGPYLDPKYFTDNPADVFKRFMRFEHRSADAPFFLTLLLHNNLPLPTIDLGLKLGLGEEFPLRSFINNSPEITGENRDALNILFDQYKIASASRGR